jgi:site-specific DNA recombinase
MGIEAQRDTVREYARSADLELVDIVQEAASGGVRQGEELSWEHRPRLLDLMERAERGELDVLLVAKLDRLSRDHASLVILERRLQRLGVVVVSATEQNGDGPIAEFIRGQLAQIAQLERAMILDRVRAGKAKKKRLGRHVHGRVPFGYTSNRGELRPDVETAETVRRIFEGARRGAGPSAIARMLNDAGTPSPTGGSWTRQAVAVMLSNPAYKGEKYGVRGAHAPIVTVRTWNAAQPARRRTV